MAPSATPSGTGVRIHGACCIHARCCIHAWCRIDRIFINHHWRPSYNDRPANHDGRFLDNDRRRRPVLVRLSFPLIAWNLAIARSYRQIGGHCRGGKS